MNINYKKIGHTVSICSEIAGYVPGVNFLLAGGRLFSVLPCTAVGLGMAFFSYVRGDQSNLINGVNLTVFSAKQFITGAAEIVPCVKLGIKVLQLAKGTSSFWNPAII